MNDYDYLKFTLELLDLICKEVQDLSWKLDDAEYVKRLNHAYKHLTLAYTYAYPIIERGI